MSTLAALLREGTSRLQGEEARADAELLLAHALGRSRAWLFAHGDEALDAQAMTRYLDLIERRAIGHPIAHLVGHRGFWSLDLLVDESTLIPRPETELLVDQALLRLPADQPVCVLDLGTGSGAVALAIAKERPRALVFGLEISDDAMRIAIPNKLRSGLGNVFFQQSDWFSVLDDDERFDVIVSNPPYIAEDDPHLQQGDLRFEPRSALASGADGLDDIRRIISQAPRHLANKGWLLLEHGFDQGDAVRDLLRGRGFASVETVQDLEQRDRVSLGQWSAE